MAKRAIEKVLSYRIPIDDGRELAILNEMISYWRGVTWKTGPYIVEWTSDLYGTIQVWAASKADGEQVIGIALMHMGAKMEDGYLNVNQTRNPRYGRVGTVTPGRVSLRNGPSGHEWSRRIIPTDAIIENANGAKQ